MPEFLLGHGEGKLKGGQSLGSVCGRWVLALNRLMGLAPAVLLAGLLAVFPVYGDSLEQVLALEEEPAGVVLEVVQSDEDGLLAVLPELRDAISRLRERFPDLEIALVSHGPEQFGLTLDNQAYYPDVHDGVRAIAEGGVEVQVCGTHAAWYGLSPEAYPDWLDVAPSGPAQINDYLDLGFRRIDF